MNITINTLSPALFKKYCQHNSTFSGYYKSSIGLLKIWGTDKGIYKVIFSTDSIAKDARLMSDSDFSTLLLVGTEFQIEVWRSLLHVPSGTTTSYQALAQTVGNKKAVRAVARALATNPIPYFIPCHRIIGKDGSLTGYNGGIEKKRALLKAEGLFF